MTTLSAKPEPVLQRLRALLGARGADLASPEGRAAERHRRAALSAMASALAKVVSVGAALITLPMALHYLGAERFGMWVTISSLVAMLAFADLGISNGVLSAVAEAHGKGDDVEIRRLVSSSFLLLSSLALLLVTGFTLAYAFVPWHSIFNVKGEIARAEAGPALAVFVVTFALVIPLAMVQRVQMGLQQGFNASLWQCLGSLIALLGVLLAVQFEAGLPWLVLALTGAPLFAAACNNLHFFGVVRPDLRPEFEAVSRAAASRVAATGAVFFVLQLAMAVVYSSDSLVIAQMLGASAVADYAIPEKLFSFISMALMMAFGPLWPAYGEAISRGDTDWVVRTLKRSFLMAGFFAASAGALLALVAPWMIKLWVGDGFVVSISLLISLAVWRTVEGIGYPLGMFLNGAGILRFQVIAGCIMVAAVLALKPIFVAHLGVSGAPLSTALIYLTVTLIPLALLLPRMLRSVRQRSNLQLPQRSGIAGTGDLDG